MPATRSMCGQLVAYLGAMALLDQRSGSDSLTTAQIAEHNAAFESAVEHVVLPSLDVSNDQVAQRIVANATATITDQAQKVDVARQVQILIDRAKLAQTQAQARTQTQAQVQNQTQTQSQTQTQQAKLAYTMGWASIGLSDWNQIDGDVVMVWSGPDIDHATYKQTMVLGNPQSIDIPYERDANGRGQIHLTAISDGGDATLGSMSHGGVTAAIGLPSGGQLTPALSVGQTITIQAR